MKVSIKITEPGDFEIITGWTGVPVRRDRVTADHTQAVTADGSAGLTADVLEAVAFHLRYRDDEPAPDATETDTEEQVS